MARHQVSAGHHVAIFCPIPSHDATLQITQEEGVRIYRAPVKPRSSFRVFLDSFSQRKLAKNLEGVIFDWNPEIVHIQHLMGLPINLVDLITKASIPMVITFHDYWYVCANAQLLTNSDQQICSGPDAAYINCGRCAIARSGHMQLNWLAPAAAPLMAYRNRRLEKVINQAKRIIAPTQFVFNQYSRLGVPEGKMEVIRHGLDVPKEKVAEARAVQRSRHSEPPLRIGYIGGISWQKGLHILVEAVRELPETTVELVVFGDLSAFPEYGQRLRHLISGQNITLAGAIEHDQIWLTLAGFDLVVLPTLWYETSSLILDEAFLVGVPVIASKLGVMEEKIKDGVNGRLFPVGDSQTLREILLELSRDPVKVERLRAGIPTVPTIDDHMQNIENVYKAVLDAL